MIPRTVLVASRPFGSLSADDVGSAIGRGLLTGGWQSDLCPIVLEDEPGLDVRALLAALDFDARMRRARAVVLAERRLSKEPPLAAGPGFEIASRARQAGVPAYAVTAQNTLNAFDARMLDLQVILEGSSRRGLEAAGRRLAELV
jgi:hypothetical protein